MTIRGPLSYFYSGGAAESEGPAADQNARGISGGSFGGGSGTGDRGMMYRALDFANEQMSKENALGTIGGGFLGGTLGMAAGVAINALDGRAQQNAKEALSEAQFSALMETGVPQIDARGHTHGAGPGATNNGGQTAGMGASAGGNNDAGTAPPVAPTDPAAGATPSTRYIPGTGDYEKILIRKDGTRTDLAGTPLTFASGGATGGGSSDGAPVSGLFAGGTPGRSDLVDTMLPEDSYILPADTVSAAGDGNTEAGALSLSQRFGQPPIKHQSIASGPIQARVSSGEFYVSPADVKKAGGADALDKMVRDLRKHYARNLSKLPGPKK